MSSKGFVMVGMVVLGSAWFGCGGSDTGTTNPGGTSTSSSSGTSGDDGSSGSSGTSGSSGASADAPTLASIQSSIFAKSCAGNTCHGAGARGGLKLTDAATSCKNLVDVAAEDSMTNPGCATGGAKAAGMKRVVPGDPSASFLYLKLVSEKECLSVGGKSAGERMPRDAAALSAAKIATIEQWIKAGASCD